MSLFIRIMNAIYSGYVSLMKLINSLISSLTKKLLTSFKNNVTPVFRSDILFIFYYLINNAR